MDIVVAILLAIVAIFLLGLVLGSFYTVQQQSRAQYNRRARSMGSRLYRDQSPAVYESVYRGGRQQRTGKSVQRLRTDLVTVIVRAAGANRKCEPVNPFEQQVARRNQHHTAQPAHVERQFRDKAERRHPDE